MAEWIKGVALGTSGVRHPDGRVAFHSASFVKAPRCVGCLTEMEPASSTDWSCPKMGCLRKDQPFNMGIYPVWGAQK